MAVRPWAVVDAGLHRAGKTSMPDPFRMPGVRELTSMPGTFRVVVGRC